MSITDAQRRVLKYALSVEHNARDGWTRFYSGERRVAWRLVDSGLLATRVLDGNDAFKVTDAGRAALAGMP